jgi:hypothetical protein
MKEEEITLQGKKGSKNTLVIQEPILKKSSSTTLPKLKFIPLSPSKDQQKPIHVKSRSVVLDNLVKEIREKSLNKLENQKKNQGLSNIDDTRENNSTPLLPSFVSPKYVSQSFSNSPMKKEGQGCNDFMSLITN